MRNVLCFMLFTLPAVSYAQITANIGGVTDYLFRGVDQTDRRPAFVDSGPDYVHYQASLTRTVLKGLDLSVTLSDTDIDQGDMTTVVFGVYREFEL